MKRLRLNVRLDLRAWLLGVWWEWGYAAVSAGGTEIVLACQERPEQWDGDAFTPQEVRVCLLGRVCLLCVSIDFRLRSKALKEMRFTD